MTYSWVSVHRVKFPEPRNYPRDDVPTGPAIANAWRCGPNAPLGDGASRTGTSKCWGGMAFYGDKYLAQDVVTDPHAHFSWLDETVEHWHALACVISHRGKVNWSTKDEPHPALTPLETDPGGVIAIVTSAGYDTIDESQFPRIRAFQEKVDDVLVYYGTLKANVARSLFSATKAASGMTFSVWTSDEEMMATAYRHGTHAEYLREHRKEPMFDHSSFTRLRLLESSGTWDGKDPRQEAQAKTA